MNEWQKDIVFRGQVQVSPYIIIVFQALQLAADRYQADVAVNEGHLGLIDGVAARAVLVHRT